MLMISAADIVRARGARNVVDPRRPYDFFIERERSAAGSVDDVATIFLVNSECPFRCLFCDLWKNTTVEPAAPGVIPAQIEFALEQLPPARHVKLYNSGNFFDARAIPRGDLPVIARIVRGFETVIVENHPRLCTADCHTFHDQLQTQLEIAIGLETVNESVLSRLNKQMTLSDFADAVERLHRGGITTRTFILLQPPFLSEFDAVPWALRSVEFAFSHGVACCSIIPTRAGNGIMDSLKAQGEFSLPSLRSLESVSASGIAIGQGRVFVDLWEADRFADCDHCVSARIDRLGRMNDLQRVLPPTECGICGR